MPIYEFRNKKTKKVIELFFSWSEREAYLKDNPNMEPVMALTNVGDPIRMGHVKPAGWFKDKLKAIKRGNPGSNINTFD
jgi:hypothetical protein